MMEPSGSEEPAPTYQRLSSLPDAASISNIPSTTSTGPVGSFLTGNAGEAITGGLGGPVGISPAANKPVNSVSGCFVKICDTERHGDDHVAYVIEVNAKKALHNTIFSSCASQPQWVVQRRYSDFTLLKTTLEQTRPACLLPGLPEKFESYVPWRMMQQKFDQDFVEFRRQRLEAFLHHLLAHPILGREDLVLLFLLEGNAWRGHTALRDLGERVSGYVDRHSASVRINSENVTLQRLRQTAITMQHNVRAVLTAMGQVSSRQLHIVKMHKEYGEALCEWCGHDREMADGLQTMGHLMDAYSSFLDNTSANESGNENTSLSPEELEFEGKLRELLHYSESMFQLARRMALLILRAEKKGERIHQLQAEVEKCETGSGLTSLKNKLMGISSPKDKELRITSLKEQITREQDVLDMLMREANDFSQTVHEELLRFHQGKGEELEKAIRTHCQLQLSRAKRSLRLWNQCRQGLEDLPNSE